MAPKVKHLAAISDPVAIAPFMRAVDAFAGEPETPVAQTLVAQVLTRPDELRLAE